MKHSHLILLFAICVWLFTGCASKAVEDVKSVTDAGVTSYHNAPVIGSSKDDVKMGEETTVVFGKEYGSFFMELTFDPETQRVMGLTVKANEVGAFPGQAAAAEAIVNVQQQLTDLGIAGTDAASGIMSEVIKAYIPVPASATE